jgi:hypothetical protein
MPATGNRVLRPKLLILAAGVAAIAGVAAFAINREAPPATSPTAVQQAAQSPRPALTAAEEQYIRALWPIHGDVQRSALRMSLGQIFYMTQDLALPELGNRVKEALSTYQTAEARLRALEPPSSLRGDHEEYLTAVRLFRESAGEVLKTVSDGQEEHLRVAYPKGQEASNKIREVGGKFWPHEFPAH